MTERLMNIWKHVDRIGDDDLADAIEKSLLNDYLTENQVYGFVVTIREDSILYTYNIMFRNNKKDPEMLYVKVSPTSKLVLESWTNRGKKFNNIEELKTYTKR